MGGHSYGCSICRSIGGIVSLSQYLFYKDAIVINVFLVLTRLWNYLPAGFINFSYCKSRVIDTCYLWVLSNQLTCMSFMLVFLFSL